MYYLLDRENVNVFNIIKNNSIFHRGKWYEALLRYVLPFHFASFRGDGGKYQNVKWKMKRWWKKEKQGGNFLRHRQESDKKYVRLKAL
jgi:hypothetical protein